MDPRHAELQNPTARNAARLHRKRQLKTAPFEPDLLAVACCARCRRWFPTTAERNEHRSQSPAGGCRWPG